jgi:hypothetical protein
MPTDRIVWFVVLPLVVLAVFVWLFWMMYRARETKIMGPALTGTAQVLTLKRGLGDDARDYYSYRIGLRVQIPDRPPYDVTSVKNLYPGEEDYVQPGKTVTVQVDSTNTQVVRVTLRHIRPNSAREERGW